MNDSLYSTPHAKREDGVGNPIHVLRRGDSEIYFSVYLVLYISRIVLLYSMLIAVWKIIR